MEVKINQVANGYVLTYSHHFSTKKKVYSSFVELITELRIIFGVDYIEKQWKQEVTQ